MKISIHPLFFIFGIYFALTGKVFLFLNFTLTALIHEIGHSITAERLGYKQSTVANKLRLLKLPDYIKKAISTGTITERHARALLNVPEEKLEEVYLTIVNRKYNVSKTEEYIKELTEAHKRKGVSSNLRIGVNTIREAYELCKRSGIDSDMQVTEYEDNVKIVIRMKK